MIIRGERVLVDGKLQRAGIHVRDGRIERVSSFADAGDGVIDAGNDVVMPGLVDTHVHVNEPGRSEWEGFASATRAAAAGGVTTIFDMPLNSIPATTTVAALDAKRRAARSSAVVNVGFTGGVVPGNTADLEPLWREGARLFKCFLVPSGVEEFPCVSEHDLRNAMPELARLGATLMVHAELPEHIVPVPSGDPRVYGTYLASRPALAEVSAVSLMIRLAEEFGTRVHIVHLSSPESLPLLRAANESGIHITAETCPHYLTFSAVDIPDGATQYKCAPPIRDAASRDALWRAVIDGEISAVVSDHSPCPPEMKRQEDGDFFQAWGGIASLQLGLPATWTAGRDRGADVALLSDRMSNGPARLAGLGHRKGRIATGYDADLVIWNPEASIDVSSLPLYHRHAITPYRDRVLYGSVQSTFVNGVKVFDAGRILSIDAGQIITDVTSNFAQ